MTTRNIVPRADGEGKIGTTTKRWGEAHFDIVELGGGQIAFPSTQAPSADPNTLDDYEEGTWTPDLQFGGAKVDITYANQDGLYTKVGRVVIATAFFTLTSKGSSVGAATIHGLPFTVKNDLAAFSPTSAYINKISFADFFQLFADINSTNIDLREVTNAGVVTTITNANFANDSSIMISFCYFV